MKKGYKLSLDEVFESPYFYTSYDIGSLGHDILIKAEDKEKFLDEFALEFRKIAEDSLVEVGLKRFRDGRYEDV